MPENQKTEDKPSILYARIEKSSKAPSIVQWLLHKGWAKRKETANTLLLAMVTVMIMTSLFLFTFGNPTNTVQDDTPPAYNPNIIS